jgi:error-prone DNA polymerase
MSQAAAMLSSTRQVQRMKPGRTVDIGGLVVCRQRPSTAQGIVFLLLEDEEGLMNVMVPADLYERCRRVVRMSSFLHVHGLLQAHAGKVPMLKAYRVDPLVDPTDLRMPAGKSWG